MSLHPLIGLAIDPAFSLTVKDANALSPGVPSSAEAGEDQE